MNRPQLPFPPLLAVLGLLLVQWFGLTQTASAVFLPPDHSDLFAATLNPGGHQENSSLPPENRVWENFGNANEITPADELNSLKLRWESHFGELELASGVLSYADGNPISLSDPFGLCTESGGVWGSIKGAASSAANSTYQFTQQLGRDYPILADAEQAVMSNIWMLDALGPAGAIETGVANAFRSVSSVAKGGRAAVALGEDLSSAAGTRVWRNVPFGHGALADAQAGIVKPYGCTINEALDVRSLGHDMGSTHGSGLTSWTADQAWALSRQNRLGGVVLETSAPNGSVWFNQAAKGAESQVLIPGTIRTR